MLDACDVKKMVLIIVGEISFHLGRIHTSIGLGDINRWNPEIRKNITRHLPQRDKSGQQKPDHCHNDCDWSSKRELNQAHSIMKSVTGLSYCDFPCFPSTTSSCISLICSRTRESTLRPNGVSR